MQVLNPSCLSYTDSQEVQARDACRNGPIKEQSQIYLSIQYSSSGIYLAYLPIDVELLSPFAGAIELESKLELTGGVVDNLQ